MGLRSDMLMCCARAARMRRRTRWGMTTAEIVTVGVVGAGLAGTAAVIVPRTIFAGGAEGDETPGAFDKMPTDSVRANAIREVRDFVRAGAVIASAQADPLRIVFWYRDDDDRGKINEDEIVLFSFHEIGRASCRERV